MTLPAADAEADLVEAHLSFHLNLGVDLVLATDHGSRGGTTEILESFARDGYVRLLRHERNELAGSELYTRMSRLAASEHGADWVISSAADEFWWPRGHDLKEVLSAIPGRYGVVQGAVRHFVPCLGGDGFFAERMTVRITARAPINALASRWRARVRVVHRGDPSVSFGGDGRALGAGDLIPLRGWYPVEVLHFGGGSRAEAHALSDEDVAHGVVDGSLAIDTRLRDALRVLRDPAGDGFVRPGGVGHRLRLAAPSLAEEAEFAGEVAMIGDASVVDVQRRLDELESHIASLNRRGRPRLVHGLRRLGVLDRT